MTYGEHRVAAHVFRHGQMAEVISSSETGTNDFGNPEYSYTVDREVLAVRTYPNRNTQIESDVGDRNQDNPVFVVPVGENQNEPPEKGELLDYDGIKYEVKGLTRYDTHVEFFGEEVINDG